MYRCYVTRKRTEHHPGTGSWGGVRHREGACHQLNWLFRWLSGREACALIEEFPHQKVNHPAHKPSSPAGPGRVEAPGVWGQTAAFPETGPHSGTHPEAAEEGNVVVAEAAVGVH